VKAVFDTNILVDFLHGSADAAAELALYQSPSISVVSWIELMVGANSQTEAAARTFLQSFTLLEIDSKIAERVVTIRKLKRIKLPDAIIQATAQVHQCLLVTRNTKDFDSRDPGIRVPYTI